MNTNAKRFPAGLDDAGYGLEILDCGVNGIPYPIKFRVIDGGMKQEYVYSREEVWEMIKHLVDILADDKHLPEK